MAQVVFEVHVFSAVRGKNLALAYSIKAMTSDTTKAVTPNFVFLRPILWAQMLAHLKTALHFLLESA